MYVIAAIVLTVLVLVWFTNRKPIIVEKFIVMGGFPPIDEDGELPVAYKMSAGYFVISQWWITKTVPVNAVVYMNHEVGDVWDGIGEYWPEDDYAPLIAEGTDNGGADSPVA